MTLISASFPPEVLAAPQKPYIVWWGNAKTLKNVSVASAGPPEDILYWQRRGGRDGGHVGIGPKRLGYVDKGEAGLLRQKLDQRFAEGYRSIALEIERRTDASDAAVLSEFKAAHPQIFIVAWFFNSRDSQPYKLLKSGIDLFIYEVYTDYKNPRGDFPAFAAAARKTGIIGKAIFAVSDINVETAETERQLRLIRELAPEMPGIAYFAYRNRPNDKAADLLAKKYFIDPVLEIGPNDFRVSKAKAETGEKITLSVKIKNIGYGPARVSADFYDGDPKKGGKVIAKKVGSRIMRAQSETLISYRWLPTAGKHKIIARLTPNNYQPLAKRRQAEADVKIVGHWWDFLRWFRL